MKETLLAAASKGLISLCTIVLSITAAAQGASSVVESQAYTPGQSQAGNPVAFGKKYFNQLRQLQGDSGGKSIIANNPESIIRLAVEDAGIVQDIDTPGDLSRFQSQT